MPRLRIDTDREPFYVASTVPLDRALGRSETWLPESSLTSRFAPRHEPHELPRPLVLTVMGKRPTSCMMLDRGTGTPDLVVSPALATLLSTFELPSHVAIPCEAEVVSLSGRVAPQRHPFVWLWWRVAPETIDFSASTFIRHDRDGSEQVSFECLEDYELLRRRSLRGDFVLVPEQLKVPTDPRALDLRPDSMEGCTLSPRLYERLVAEALPGIILES